MELNVVTYPSGAKSAIGIIARGNNVIVRLDFDTSLLMINALANKKKPNSTEENENVKMTVVAVGKDVKDLEVGDVVRSSTQPEITLDVKDNENTIDKLYKKFSKFSANEQDAFLRGGTKIHVTEYSLYSDFQLPVIIDPIERKTI